MANDDSDEKVLVRLANSLTDEELEQVAALERELFPENLRDDLEFIRASFGHPETVTVIAYCPEGRVAGYISSLPHNDVSDALKAHDPEFSGNSDALYLQSIAVRPDLQGQGYFSKLMKKFLEGAGERTVTMHARISNNCSVGMQKYGAEYVRSVSDWFGTGEVFDYLEIRTLRKSFSGD